MASDVVYMLMYVSSRCVGHGESAESWAPMIKDRVPYTRGEPMDAFATYELAEEYVQSLPVHTQIGIHIKAIKVRNGP